MQKTKALPFTGSLKCSWCLQYQGIKILSASFLDFMYPWPDFCFLQLCKLSTSTAAMPLQFCSGKGWRKKIHILLFPTTDWLVLPLRSANGDDLRQGWYSVSNLFWPSAFPTSNCCVLRGRIFLKSMYAEDGPGLTKSRLKCNIFLCWADRAISQQLSCIWQDYCFYVKWLRVLSLLLV